MTQKTSWKVLKNLWPQIRAFRFRLILGIVLICLTTTFDLLGPLLIGKVADGLVAPQPNSARIVTLCFYFLAVIAGKALCEMCQAYTIQTTGLLITQKLRTSVFNALIRFPASYYDQNASGRLITRVINDVRSLSELFTASMSVLALDVMVIAGTVLSMFILDWKLAGVVLLTFPLVIWVIFFFGKRLAEAYKEARARLSEINGFLGENIAAMPTIHRLSAQDERQDTFNSIVSSHQTALNRSIQAYAQVQPWANVLNGIAMASLLGVGGFWVIEGKLKVGILVAFLAYLRNLFQPIRDLVEKYNVVLSAMVSAERVAQVLAQPLEDIERGEGVETLARVPKPWSIRFENVTFQYVTRNLKALDKVGFVLEGGQSLAIVGATGSGKSTLAKLLLGFYEPNEGDIFLGNVPIRSLSKGDLRRHVAFIPQDVYLFEGTVRENLRLSQETLNDEFLVQQCEKAQLWDCIKNRGGLELKIEEGGNNLSLGEKQLLSFARTMVLNPEILVLDEATASLDNATERRLMVAVKELVRGRTSMIIAHRLSTIESCDSVILLQNGQVKEQGTLLELRHQKGLFEKFYELYQQGKRD